MNRDFKIKFIDCVKQNILIFFNAIDSKMKEKMKFVIVDSLKMIV